VDNHARLKGLRTQETRVRGQLDQLKQDQAKVSREITTLSEQLKNIQTEIESLKSPEEILITEHAILRYLERVKGIDIEAIKQEILPKNVRDQAMVLGGSSGKYPTATHTVIVKTGVVVTIIPKDEANG
jgi:TolA-binding protein